MSADKIIFLIYIFLLPFDGTDYLGIFVDSVHVGIVDILLAILLYMVIINMQLLKRAVPHLFQKFLFLFLLAICLSFVNFFYIPVNTMAHDLKFTLNLIEYLSLFFIVSMVVDNLDYMKKVLASFSGSAVLFALLTIAKSLGLHMPGYDRMSNGRIGPFFIGSVALFNGMMPFALIALPTLSIFAENVIIRKSWTKFLLISVVLLAVVISFSRSLYGAVVGQAFLLWYFNVHKKMSSGKKWLFLLFLIPGFFIASQLICEKITALIEVRIATVEARMQGYSLALDLITSNIHSFLFGVGKGVYIQKSIEFLDEGSVVHNFLLDIFVSKGIFMVVVIGSILIMILKKLLVNKMYLTKDPVLMSFALTFGLSMAGMIAEGMFAPITTSITFWTITSLAYSFILIAEREEI